MTNTIKIFGLLVLTSFIFSCQKENHIKDFGKWTSLNDSLRVDLNLKSFDSLPQLLEKIEDISCNDSFPSIKIANRKRIYLINSCMRGISCRLIKRKNILELQNDTIKKRWLKFPLDSLENVLNRDYHNNGKDFMYSDRPDKLIIRISTDSNGFDEINNKLELITDIYERITDTTDVKIEISRIKRRPPPPPIDFEKIDMKFE